MLLLKSILWLSVCSSEWNNPCIGVHATDLCLHSRHCPRYLFFLLKKLRLTSRFSYILEARTIFALSAIHLIILQIMISRHAPLSENWRFFMGNVIPVSIYILCLIANITGIRMAAKYDILKIVIRIAPLCCDKLLLVRREDNKWDLPVIRTYNGALRKADSFAERLVEDFLHYKKESP